MCLTSIVQACNQYLALLFAIVLTVVISYFQDRNKLYLTKLILQEILLILRFKSSLPERTIRYLMQVYYIGYHPMVS